MGFYDDMQAAATELLTEFGQGTIYLVQTGAATGDPWNPVPGATTQTLIHGAATGVSQKYIDRSLAVASDKQIICSVLLVEPTLADWVTIDGAKYKIVHVGHIPEAGTTVALLLIVRAA